MKVAVIGSIWLHTPPRQYGGTEEVIGNIVDGLVDKGHDVTFFGPKSSNVKGKIFPTLEKPTLEMGLNWTDNENIHYTILNITAALDRADEFDIIHMHLNKSHDYFSLPLAIYSKTPVVFTFHLLLPSPTHLIERYQVLSKYQKLPFTTISNSQRAGLPWNFVRTVYNSLNLANFPFSATTDDYFVWLGRVKQEKGTKEAILAAKKAGIKLFVMGAIEKNVPEQLAYYEKEIKPLCDGSQVVWLGEADFATKVKYLQRAKALLNPIQWEEPFGLVMAEAQAVGTPVIGFARGAAPELVVDGKTGFLITTIDEMVEKIKLVDTIDRRACRKNIEDKFTIDTMIEGYVHAYQAVQENWDTYRGEQRAFLQSQK